MMPTGEMVALTNEDSPEINEGEECHICELLEREDEGEKVVRYALREAIHGVEGVAGVRGRHYPFVVRFVQRLVDFGVMQAPMDPVDKQIREENEQWELKKVVESEWSVGRSVVEFCITANLKQEEGRGQNCHERHGDHGLANLQPNLMFKILGVGESGVVKDKNVRERGKDEVEHQTEKPR